MVCWKSFLDRFYNSIPLLLCNMCLLEVYRVLECVRRPCSSRSLTSLMCNGSGDMFLLDWMWQRLGSFKCWKPRFKTLTIFSVPDYCGSKQYLVLPFKNPPTHGCWIYLIAQNKIGHFGQLDLKSWSDHLAKMLCALSRIELRSKGPVKCYVKECLMLVNSVFKTCG